MSYSSFPFPTYYPMDGHRVYSVYFDTIFGVDLAGTVYR